MSKIYTFYNQDQSFKWIDVSEPSTEDLLKLATDHQLHPTSVQDCLEPDHLPKYERHTHYRFIMLRAYDSKATAKAGTLNELTRKVAIFSSDQFIITIHRKDLGFLEILRSKWSERLVNYVGNPKNHLCLDIMSEVFLSYDPPLHTSYLEMETFEEKVFSTGKESLTLQKAYPLKRKLSVLKRVLRMSLDVTQKFIVDSEDSLKIYTQDLKEDLENTYFNADDLSESITQLLNIHLAQEAQKTNDSMRTLTLFSAFFMPPTLIAGIYGMNFQHFPELKWEHGYYYCLGFMLVIAVGNLIWFKIRHWF